MTKSTTRWAGAKSGSTVEIETREWDHHVEAFLKEL